MAQKEEEKNKEQEEELTPVGEGADTAPDETEKEKKEPKEEGHKEENDEEDGEEEEASDQEERLGHGEGEDERESRRNERKRRKQLQREARDRNQRELHYLRARNEQLERRFSDIELRINRSEVSNVDSRITQLKSQLKVADQVIAKAIEQGKGDDAVKAQGIRDEIRDSIRALESQKETITESGEEEREETETPQPEAPRVNPAVIALAKNWIKDKPWVKPGGQDKDSVTLRQIEADLMADGFNPAEPEYWDEMTERAKEELPHRFEKQEDREDRGSGKPPAKKPSGGPRFSTGGRERPLRKGEVYVSRDRREALEELGAWDDPVLRSKYLKAFAKYDREQAGQSN